MKKIIALLMAAIMIITMLPLSALALGEPDYQSETLYGANSVKITLNAITRLKSLLDEKTNEIVYETLSNSLARSNGYGVTVFQQLNEASDVYCIFITNATPYNYNYFYHDRGANAYKYGYYCPMVYALEPVANKSYNPLSDYKTKFGLCAKITVDSESKVTRLIDYEFVDNITSNYTFANFKFSYNQLVYSNAVPKVYSSTSYNIYTNYVFNDYSDILHTLTWLDMLDEVIAITTVYHGSAAEAPEATEYNNYYFIGWDKDFSCVTDDMVIKAQYTNDPRFANRPGYKKIILNNNIDDAFDVQFVEIGSYFLESLKELYHWNDNLKMFKTPFVFNWKSVEETRIFRGFKYNNKFIPSNSFEDFQVTEDVFVLAYYGWFTDDHSADGIDDGYDINDRKTFTDIVFERAANLLTGTFKVLFIPSDNYFNDKVNTILAKLQQKVDITSFERLMVTIQDLKSSNSPPNIQVPFTVNGKTTNYQVVDFRFMEEYKDIYNAAFYAFCYVILVFFLLRGVLKLFKTGE